MPDSKKASWFGTSNQTSSFACAQFCQCGSTKSCEMSEEESIKKHRQEALMMLEGKLYAIHFDCTSNIRRYFERLLKIRAKKERKARELQSTRESKTKRKLDDRTGWKHLCKIIIDHLDENDAQYFPPYQKDQRAWVLNIEDIGGHNTVHSTRKLNGRSASELLDMMKQIETRGWRDMIWVSTSDNELSCGTRIAQYTAKEMQWPSDPKD